MQQGTRLRVAGLALGIAIFTFLFGVEHAAALLGAPVRLLKAVLLMVVLIGSVALAREMAKVIRSREKDERQRESNDRGA